MCVVFHKGRTHSVFNSSDFFCEIFNEISIYVLCTFLQCTENSGVCKKGVGTTLSAVKLNSYTEMSTVSAALPHASVFEVIEQLDNRSITNYFAKSCTAPCVEKVQLEHVEDRCTLMTQDSLVI